MLSYVNLIKSATFSIYVTLGNVDVFACCAAACLAQSMGVPLTIVAAVNRNDIVAKMIDTGELALSAQVLCCLSSAMDIQVNHITT